MIKNLKCLIVDMDGTILDSEKTYAEGYRRAYANHNLKVSEEEILSYSGQDMMTVLKRVDLHTNDREFSLKIRQERLDYFQQSLENGTVKLHKHTKELIAFCKENGLKVGLVTSTNTKWAQKILSYLGILESFDFTVFGDEVENNKPAPDAYYLALQKAGLSKEECLVVEDSDSGIRAAIAAGIATVQIEAEESPTFTYPELFGKADNLQEVEEIVRQVLYVSTEV